jgi:hypothetical protein
MAEFYDQLGSFSVLSASNSTIYTVPGATQTGVKVLWICNHTALPVTIEIWHVRSGDSAVDSNARLSGVTIPANDFKKIQADWEMATGDTIEAKGATNLAITVAAYGLENT